MHVATTVFHRIAEFFRLLWRALYRFFGDGCPGSAAALSFYTFLSLPALLTLLLTIVGKLTDPQRVQAAITDQVGRLVGRAGAEQIGSILTSVRESGSGASLTAVLSIIFVVFGATTAFAQLQSALNHAWDVTPDPHRNQLKVFLRKRVFSFGIVIAVAFLLLVSLAITTALQAFGDAIAGVLPASTSTAVLRVGGSVLSLVVLTGVFAVMFRYLPDALIRWTDVIAGAFATALLFTAGRFIIAAYIGSTDPGTAYGAAGSLAVVLIWVYYSSMIVLYGAEFTRVWADRYGGGVRPEPGAVRTDR